MSTNEFRTMRDAFLERIYAAMKEDDGIFFVSADFGSPVLDKIRADFVDRYINVGIAEQNCVNISTGLALEGYAVFAYGIAGFVSMRCYEQVRNNLALSSQVRPVNVNIVGVGAGLSYDLSGPSHHCLEDLTLMRLLPNIEVLSPSDWQLAQRLADYCLKKGGPKYLRFDSKPTPRIYGDDDEPNLENGFCELMNGDRACIVSTGYMTHVALRAAARLDGQVGVIDVFGLTPADERPLLESLKGYRSVVTVEEGFINRGGLDSYVSRILMNNDTLTKVTSLGVDDRYLFELGGRERLHRICGIDEDGIAGAISEVVS